MTRHPMTISRSGPGVRDTVLAVLMAIVWLLGASVARAAAPAELERLIRQGNELRQKGSDQAALPFFQRAYDLLPSPRTAAQLGLVELALGYSLQAEEHLNEALSSPHHLWVSRNRQQLETALAEARKAIGRIQVTGSPAGATVLINASPAGTLPLSDPVKVSEGSVKVVVKAAGFEEKMLKVNVAGGGNVKVVVYLAPAAGGAAAAARARDGEGDGERGGEAARPSPRPKTGQMTGQMTGQTTGQTTGQVAAAQLAESFLPAPASSRAWIRPGAWVATSLAVGAFGYAGYNFVRAKQSGDAFNAEAKPGTREHACDAGIEGQGAPLCAEWASYHSEAQRLGLTGVVAGVLLGTAATVGFLWPVDNPGESVALVPSRDGFGATWNARF